MTTPDEAFMREALRHAQGMLGRTWPNPSVGAVVVRDGQVVAAAATTVGGRPHAEPQALALAGEAARGATLYVSLEPCSHTGRTPPCTEAIIAAGIARVVVACTDTNPLISGSGIRQLQAAGVQVEVGCLGSEARHLNAGFFSVIERGRPMVMLKVSTSADGYITRNPGTPTPLTGESVRLAVHQLRSEYDALLTGMGTVLSDDPLLTCRLPIPNPHTPVRVVIDRQHRLHGELNLIKSAEKGAVWVITWGNHPQKARLESQNIRFLQVNCRDSSDFLLSSLKLLAQEGITRLMVEAGAELSSALLQSDMIDTIYWFRSPTPLYAGLPAFGDPKASEWLLETPWRLAGSAEFPPDSLDIFTCLPELSPT